MLFRLFVKKKSYAVCGIYWSEDIVIILAVSGSQVAPPDIEYTVVLLYLIKSLLPEESFVYVVPPLLNVKFASIYVEDNVGSVIQNMCLPQS